MLRKIIAVPLFLLASCTTPPHAPFRGSMPMLNGQWDNSAQMADAPETLKRPPVAGGAYEWIDFQHARFFPVDVPALTSDGSKVLYLIWRSNGPDGPVSRQRLWVFRTNALGATTMDFFAFKNPQPFESVTDDDGQFKAITREDLTAYGPQCTLPVRGMERGWSASIPSTCEITARSGRKMVLSAQIVVNRDSISYREQGTLESGALAFKVPGGPAYRFERLKGR